MFCFIKYIPSIVMILCGDCFSSAMDMVENSSPIKSIQSFSDVLHIENTVCSPDCTGDNVAKGKNNQAKKNIPVCLNIEINGNKYSLENFQNNSLEDMKAILAQYCQSYKVCCISYQLKAKILEDTYQQYKFALLLRHGSTLVTDGAYKRGNPTLSCSVSNITQISNWKEILKAGATIITSDLSRAKTTGLVLGGTNCKTDAKLHELTLPENYQSMSIEDMLKDKEVQKMCVDHSYNIGGGESVQKKAKDLADCIVSHITSNNETTKNIISHVFVSHCIAIGSFIAEYSNGFIYPERREYEGVVCPPVTKTLDAALIACNVTNNQLSIVKYPLASSEVGSVKRLCFAFLEKTIDQMMKETPNDNK